MIVHMKIADKSKHSGYRTTLTGKMLSKTTAKPMEAYEAQHVMSEVGYCVLCDAEGKVLPRDFIAEQEKLLKTAQAKAPVAEPVEVQPIADAKPTTVNDVIDTETVTRRGRRKRQEA